MFSANNMATGIRTAAVSWFLFRSSGEFGRFVFGLESSFGQPLTLLKGSSQQNSLLRTYFVFRVYGVKP